VSYLGLLNALGCVTAVGHEGNQQLAEAFALLEDADAAGARRERAAAADERVRSSLAGPPLR